MVCNWMHTTASGCYLKMNKKQIIIVLILLSLLVIGIFFIPFNTIITPNSINYNVVENPNELRTSATLDTGWAVPSIVENIDLENGKSWSYDYRSYSQNDEYSRSYIHSADNTDWLRFTGFGISLPDDATIDGIEIRIDKYASESDAVVDYHLYLRNVDGQDGDDKADTSTYWDTTDTDTYTIYGSNSDDWNIDFTITEINSNTFGVDFACDGNQVVYAYVDVLQIKIHYTSDILDTGWINSDTQESIDTAGNSWSNPTNAETQDNNYADVLFTLSSESDTLRCTNFGFTIPNGATIKGIQFRMDHGASSSDSITDYLIKLVDSTGEIGENKAKSGYWYFKEEVDLYRYYGNASDMWNTELDYSDINSNSFGIDIITDSESTYRRAYIDHVQIKVFYSTAVADTDPPTYDTITEIDPLELGNYQNISINVYDDSTISHVYLEYDATNHTMALLSGDTYYNDTWNPSEIGTYNYTIWMIDEYDNTNTTGILNFTVQDTIKPTYDNINYIDPLELGNYQNVSINVYDISDIIHVYLEYDATNHTMVLLSGDTYYNDTWNPSETGTYNFTIWMIDIAGNTNQTTVYYFDVETEITYPPTYDTLLIYYNPIIIGYNEIIQINVYATNGTITFVIITIDNINYTFINIYNDTYECKEWISNTTGLKDFVIYMKDNNSLITTIYGQIAVYDPSDIVMNVMGFVILFILLIAMLLCYYKFRIFIIVVIIEIFSIVFGILALSYYQIPFQPYLTIFFLVFQSALFIDIMLKIFQKNY